MNELNQKLYELVVNIAPHDPSCPMMVNFIRGNFASDEQCTCWKHDAIELIEQIDKLTEETETN